jgi:hypothetical protein
LTRYEQIGHGYAATRREDPAVRARLHAALRDARTVVNDQVEQEPRGPSVAQRRVSRLRP